MTFAPVVATIMRHLNDDHADGCVLICRALGGQPGATVMTGMDQDGIEFSTTMDGRDVPVRMPCGHRLSQRAEVRVGGTRMYDEARAQPGLPGRVPATREQPGYGHRGDGPDGRDGPGTASGVPGNDGEPGTASGVPGHG